MAGISGINPSNIVNNVNIKGNPALNSNNFVNNIKEVADEFVSSRTTEKVGGFFKKIGNYLLEKAKDHPILSAITVFSTVYGGCKFGQILKNAPKEKTLYTPEFSPEMTTIYNALRSGQIAPLPDRDGQMPRMTRLPAGRSYIPSSEPIAAPVDRSTLDKRFIELMKQADKFEQRLSKSDSLN